MRIPATPNIGLTGWVSAPIHDIAVWNGDPRIDPIVDWARQRFAYAALPPPQPTSVTFMPPVDGDRWDAWGFLTGSDAPDLGLPFTADEACPDDPCRWPTSVRAAALHEFAHLWLARLTTRVGLVRGPLAAGHDVPRRHELTWYDPNLPWRSRGSNGPRRSSSGPDDSRTESTPASGP